MGERKSVGEGTRAKKGDAIGGMKGTGRKVLGRASSCDLYCTYYGSTN